MSKLNFSNIAIKSICSAVPKQIIDNDTYSNYYPKNIVNEIINKTGIIQRRFAPENMCASDYSFHAAEELLTLNNIRKSEIDGIIFVSQTADYKMPATAILLQNKLGLLNSTFAFDINLGCSGYVYGLSVAYSFLLNPSINNVILAVGETRSRIYHPKDRKTAFLFGDGGTATLISKTTKKCSTHFELFSDGSKSHLIQMKAGGYRNPTNETNLKEYIYDEFNNISSDNHGRMDGSEVFNFALKEIPKSIQSILKSAKIDEKQIKLAYLHQANKFMNDHLEKKMKMPLTKFPKSLDLFGNTSSVSIPLTITTQTNSEEISNSTILLSGFGVGMSWANCVMETDNINILPLIEI